MDISIEDIPKSEFAAVLPDLASLRISVFREYPYLYDGDIEYEKNYLEQYVESPEAYIVGAFDNGKLVGAATGAPLEDSADAFSAPFRRHGFALKQVFYFGESVLDKPYRGRGIGHAFFDRREAYARSLNRQYASFCAVMRPPNHPLKPPGYTPLDPFWLKRGYQPVNELTTQFSWKDVDEGSETEKKMQFWLRDLHQSD